MKAISIQEFGGPEKLLMEDVPKPEALANEVIIEVAYTSVNPVDWKIREGYLKEVLPHKFPLIPGWDASGVVSSVGKNVKNLKVGDEVFAYCRKPIVQAGTYAEYVACEASNIALKPKNIQFSQAAALPLVALTAWQALFDVAKLKEGQKVLIHAGAGGVGSLAIQLAKQTGAFVVTTASLANHAYVKTLGADLAIDYKNGFVKELKIHHADGFDVVFDCAGGNSLRESLEFVKPNGHLVSIVEPIDPSLAEKHHIQATYVFVRPNGQQLAEIAKLIESERIALPHIEEMPLKEAAKAHERSREGHCKGKIVLKVKD